MNHRPLALSTALALALATHGAAAMGLGPLQVKSGLNQPLVAEIPIVSATAAELDQLDVRLASAEAFGAHRHVQVLSRTKHRGAASGRLLRAH